MVVSVVGLVSNLANEIEQGRFCFLRAEFAWTTFIIQGNLSATDRFYSTFNVIQNLLYVLMLQLR